MNLKEILDNNTIWGSEAAKIKNNFAKIEQFSDNIQLDLRNTESSIRGDLGSAVNALTVKDDLLTLSINNLRADTFSAIDATTLTLNNKINAAKLSLSNDIVAVKADLEASITSLEARLADEEYKSTALINSVNLAIGTVEDAVPHMEAMLARAEEIKLSVEQTQRFAEQAKVDALAYKNAGAEYALIATNKANEASSSSVLSSQYKNQSLAAASTATENATLAAKYANEDEDVEIIPGVYSAKHWAIKSSKGGLNLTTGPKYSSIDPGELFDISIGDDYLYVCVAEGNSGNAKWKKTLLFIS